MSAEVEVVLVTDLVGSTELLSALGEEAAAQVRRAHDEALEGVVSSHAGRVVKRLGDGVLAVFAGAGDAVGAAVAAQQRIDVLARKLEQPLSMRVGVSAGDVSGEDGDVFGAPVVEASRLCGVAEGGQILCAELVRLLARGRGGFEFTSLGSVELKGLPEPVAVAEVGWSPLSMQEAVGGLPLPRPLSVVDLPLAGRGAELASLVERWEAARSGEAHLVLVSGEPGIGKSRLSAELARRVYEDGATVLYGACSEDLDLAYEPFVEALRHVVGHAPLESLRSRLGRFPGDLVRLVPELGDVVSDLPEPLRSDPETQRHRLFAAVGSWLERSAEEGAALVVVVEDLHWADAASLSLLRHLLREVASAPLLVCATYRDTDLDRTHPLAQVLGDLRREASVSRVDLAGLGVEEIVELMRSTAQGAELDERAWDLAAAIWRETEGNPFFVVEVLRHLAETGAVYQDPLGRWTSGFDVAELSVPEGVREVVGRRVSRLSEAADEALSAASVVGSEFSLDVLVRLLGRDEEVVLDALEEAVGANLVRETGVGSYRFAHALVRTTLYEELSATRRGRRHLAVARLLESRGADPADLAFHYARAGAGEKTVSTAVDYAIAAGQKALDEVAPDQAATYFSQALALLDDLEEQESRRRVQAHIGLGTAQRDAGTAGYREVLLKAADLAERLGEAQLLAVAALANHRSLWSVVGQVDAERVAVLRSALNALPPAHDAMRARLLSTLVSELTFASDASERDALATEAESVARRLGDPEVLADVLAAKVVATSNPESVWELVRIAGELVGIAKDIGDPARLAQACFFAARELRTVGRTEEAREMNERAQAIVRDLAHEPTLLLVSAGLVAHHILEADLERAEALALEALERGQRTGQPDSFLWFMGQLGSIRWLQGRLDELAESVVAVVAELQEWPTFNALVAPTLWRAGRLDEARSAMHTFVDDIDRLPFDFMWLCGVYGVSHVVRALEDAERAEILYERLRPYPGQMANAGATILGSSDHALGLCAAAIGRLDDATSHFADAAALEEGAGMRGWLMFTHLEWARTLLERGYAVDVPRVLELLDRARVTAEEIGNTKVIEDVEGLRATAHPEGVG